MQAFAAGRHGIVTRDELRALGFSANGISRRVASGSLVRLYPGVFRVSAVASSWIQQVYAACRWLGPDAVVSHRSAARIWELGDVRMDRPEVTVTRDRKSARGVIVHRVKHLPRSHRRTRRLIVVSDPTRTAIDCCAVLSPSAAEAVIDDVLHARLSSLEKLQSYIDELSARGRDGVATARHLLERRIREAKDPESRLTRKLLRLIQSSPLPNPVSLHPIRLPNGRVIHPDLAYPDLMIAIEADGYRFHGNERRWRADLRRSNALQRLGWIVLRFTWDDITKKPEYVVRSIAGALRQRGLLIPSF